MIQKALRCRLARKAFFMDGSVAPRMVAATKSGKPLPGKHTRTLEVADDGLFEPFKITRGKGPNGEPIVVCQDVPCVDEHEIYDEDGNFVANCDTALLKWIAANTNADLRELSEGVPLTLGHTLDDAPEGVDRTSSTPVRSQPPIIGWAEGFYVAPLVNPKTGESVGRDAIYARKMTFTEEDIDKYDLKRFPRRSVELWLDDRPKIDPIALLGPSCPERSLGLLKLSRNGSKRIFTRPLTTAQSPRSQQSRPPARQPVRRFRSPGQDYVQNDGDDLVGRIVAALGETAQFKFLQGLMTDPGMMEAFMARHDPMPGLDEAANLGEDLQDLNTNGVNDVLDERAELAQPYRHARQPVRHANEPRAGSGLKPGTGRLNPTIAAEQAYGLGGKKPPPGATTRMAPPTRQEVVNPLRHEMDDQSEDMGGGDMPMQNARGGERGYQGSHPANQGHGMESSQDYFMGSEKKHGGHHMGAERPLTETELDIGHNGSHEHPQSAHYARGGAPVRMEDESQYDDEYDTDDSASEAALEDAVDLGEDEALLEEEEIGEPMDEVVQAAERESEGGVCPHCGHCAGMPEHEIDEQEEEVIEDADGGGTNDMAHMAAEDQSEADEIAMEEPLRQARLNTPQRHPRTGQGSEPHPGGWQTAAGGADAGREAERMHEIRDEGGRMRPKTAMQPHDNPRQTVKTTLAYDEPQRQARHESPAAMADMALEDDLSSGDMAGMDQMAMDSPTVGNHGGLNRSAVEPQRRSASGQPVRKAKLKEIDSMQSGPPKPGMQHPIRRAAGAGGTSVAGGANTAIAGPVAKKRPQPNDVNSYRSGGTKNPAEVQQLNRSSQARRPVKRMRTVPNTQPQEMLSADEITELRARLTRMDQLENEVHALRNENQQLQQTQGILVKNARRKAFAEKLARRRTDLLLAENEGIQLDLNEEIGEPGEGDAYTMSEPQWQRKLAGIRLRYRRSPTSGTLPFNPAMAASARAPQSAPQAMSKDAMWAKVNAVLKANSDTPTEAMVAAYRQELGVG